MRNLLLSVGLATCLGCSALGLGSPEIDPVQTAGDLGAIGCVGVVTQARPDQLEAAKLATDAAAAVLNGDAPSMEALSAAFDAANLPAQYRAVATVAITRIQARVEASGVLDRDSQAFKMAHAFVTACQASLGA